MIASIAQGDAEGVMFLFVGVIMVFGYALAAFVMGAISALLYNVIANMVGGFRIDLR